MKQLDVLYSINNDFVEIMLMSISSLIINGDIDNLKIHIITSDFDDNCYNKINNFATMYPNVEFFYYPLENFNIEKYNLPDWRGSQIANARLFFQEILGKNLDDIKNLLYLDADTLVVSAITGLEDYQNCNIGAVIDSGKLKYFKDLGLNIYYNSGVLYINVDNWLNNNYQDSIIKTIEDNKLNLILPDQDILNYSLGNEITSLPLEYNMNSYEFLFKGLSSKLFFNDKIRLVSHSKVSKAKENPRILHACGFANIKPWSNNKVNPFNEEFMKYLYGVNPMFEKEKLDGFRKVLSMNPQLLKLFLIVKNYCPENMDNFLSNIHLKLEGSQLRHKKIYKKQLNK